MSCAGVSRSSSTPARRTSGRRRRSKGEMGEGTGGVTEAYKRRIVLPLAGPIQLDRPRARPRARPRLPVRHHQHQRQLRQRRRAEPAALVHRGDGGIPVDRPGRSAHGDVDARGGAAREAARRSTSWTTRAISRIATATPSGRIIGGTVRRRGGRRHAARRRRRRAAATARRSRACCRSRPKELSKEWHDALFQAYRPIAETTKMPGAVARAVIPRSGAKRS